MFSARILTKYFWWRKSLTYMASKNTTDSKSKTEECLPRDIILVTGGAGFLGQHIIRLLQERVPYVSEIRVLDVKPFVNHLGFREVKKITSLVGSIQDSEITRRACKGVNSVFHIAGLVSFGTFPDFKGMEEVNVTGTNNIIKACLLENVDRLVFCSTVDVVVGHSEITDGDEENTNVPDKFLFPGYPDTKYRAEKAVLEAHGQRLLNGKKLRTVTLRANVMYGEGDPYYIINGLRQAKAFGGVMMRVGNGSALFQQAYVGNTAWAFICADSALRKQDEVGGTHYFVPDDTPVMNTFQFMEPYLRCRNFRLSKIYLPYRLVYSLVYLMEVVLKLLSPWFRINVQTASCSIKYINMNLYFSSRRARRVLGFTPIFTTQEAEVNSIAYYKEVKL